ncbi:MAG: TRAP transporter large permease subunit, partial [Gammaproteobacteria bacterium]|nr:TRAP transporter large permease subunit [Gammaproteobacteria bacterium]
MTSAALTGRMRSAGRRLENGLVLVVLAAMATVPLMELVAREVFDGGIAGSIPLVQHLTLWITFLGAALAARSDQLLALSTASFLPARAQTVVRAATAWLAVAVTGCLLLASLELTRVDHEYGDIVAWGIPVWLFSGIMPLGFALIAARLVQHGSDRSSVRFAVATGCVVPLAMLLWPDFPAAGLVLPASLALVAATALGLPIFAAIGGIALLLFWHDGIPASAVPGEAYRMSTSPMLPAIPLFTLAGYILAEGGSSQRLLRFCSALVGWMPGGLAIVTTLVLAFFTPLTGASGITILAMGGLLLPMLVKGRYTERNAIGLVTVSGSIGVLFPPSLPVILYAYYAEVELDRLFVGGLLPGVLLVLVVAAWGARSGWRAGAPRTPFRPRELLAALWHAKWELLLPVIVLYSLFGGFATLVEASALTV